MPKIEPIPPIEGADALFTLLDLLKAPDAYQKRLGELTALRDQINAQIALAGQAEAIPGLYEAAAEDRRQAAAVLAQAKVEAKGIKGAAETARDEARADADIARAEAAVSRSASAKEQGEWAETLAAQKAEIASLERDAKASFAAAEGLREQAEALRAEWQAKTDTLREAMAR